MDTHRKVLVVGTTIIVIHRTKKTIIRQSFDYDEAVAFYRAFGNALSIVRLSMDLPEELLAELLQHDESSPLT